MSKLKTIDPAETSFIANGQKYFIESELSIQRAVYAEAVKMELETGLQLGKQLDEWIKLYDLANQQKFADIVVMAYNNRRGFRDFFKSHMPVLKLCACFMNTEDEDRRQITDDMVNKKVADWQEEGISINSFFRHALTSLRAGLGDSGNGTQAISDLIKEYNQKVSAEETDTRISV